MSKSEFHRALTLTQNYQPDQGIDPFKEEINLNIIIYRMIDKTDLEDTDGLRSVTYPIIDSKHASHCKI